MKWQMYLGRWHPKQVDDQTFMAPRSSHQVQEGTGRDWWVGGRMASTRSVVAVKEDKYAKGASTAALRLIQ